MFVSTGESGGSSEQQLLRSSLRKRSHRPVGRQKTGEETDGTLKCAMRIAQTRQCTQEMVKPRGKDEIFRLSPYAQELQVSARSQEYLISSQPSVCAACFNITACFNVQGCNTHPGRDSISSGKSFFEVRMRVQRRPFECFSSRCLSSPTPSSRVGEYPAGFNGMIRSVGTFVLG